MLQLRSCSVVALGLAVVVCAGARLSAARYDIDPARSTITIHVKKAGLFRAFGDDHEVRAPITSGAVDDGPNAAVDVVIEASQMRVLDPGLSESNRREVQDRMLGPEVLDVAQYPQIRFQSTKVERTTDGLRITGQLTLHGTTRPIVVAVTGNGGRYRGTASFKQTTFGIAPVTVAGGTVKVKDELSIDFDITTRPTP